MLVQKHLFYTPRLDLEIGQSIPVTVGYETYGQLTPARDNAILICHHFSGTSHAAGQYHADEEPGWWDPLIGPGKPFDTNRYCVVAVDSLCNLNVKDPRVITTGPVTTNPATGRPYGPEFPQVTIRDNVRLQRLLLSSLGIERLVCVAGPSMGGFQALEWAVTFPHSVGKVIAAASAEKSPAIFALAFCQAAIEMITLDPAYDGGEYVGTEGPVKGLSRAAQLITALGRSDAWVTQMWGRKTAVASAHPWADREGRYAFQSEMEQIGRVRAQQMDANHFIYTARACILHDIGHGNRGLEVAVQNIRADLLLLPVSSDLLFTAVANRALVEALRLHGGRGELIPVDSPNGHLAVLYESNRLAKSIIQFLSRDEMH